MKRSAFIILLALFLTAFGGFLYTRGTLNEALAEGNAAETNETETETEAETDQGAGADQWEARWEMDGLYGPTEGLMAIDGNVLMTAAGVELQNMVIRGDMVLEAALGEGSIKLNNVTVAGRLILQGGGTDGGIVLTDSQVNTMVIGKGEGSADVLLEGHAAVWSVRVESAANLRENGTGVGFGHIYYNSDQPLSLWGGSKTLTVENEGGAVNLEAGSIRKVYIESKAADTVLTLADRTSVGILELFAPIDVQGKGSVDVALVKTDGSSLAKAPQSYEFAEGKSITVAGRVVNENTIKAPQPEPAPTRPQPAQPAQPSQPAKPAVSISKADNLTLDAGKTATRSFTVNPADAVLSVASNNAKVAAAGLSGNTVTVTGQAGGTAVITVTATKNGFVAAKTSFTVTVKAPPPPVAVGNVQVVEHQPMFGMASIRIWLSNTTTPDRHAVTVFGNRCNYNSAGYFELVAAMDDDLAKKTPAEIRAAVKID